MGGSNSTKFENPRSIEKPVTEVNSGSKSQSESRITTHWDRRILPEDPVKIENMASQKTNIDFVESKASF
jgi:hypothetical protein